MTAATLAESAPAPRRERRFFLAMVALVWVGVLSGFGFDSVRHVSQHGLDYPPIVHLHAVVFTAWIALFTAQVVFIQRDRPDLHRRLGQLGAVFAAVMIVLGPVTAFIVDTRAYVTKGEPPTFLAVQLSDMLMFATFVIAGLLLRHRAETHKRLMLLSLLSLSGAGFARFLNGVAAAPFGLTGYWGDAIGLNLINDLLLLGLAGYDLATRRRLHPVTVVGGAALVAAHLTAAALLPNPAWTAFTIRLIGH